MRRTESRSSRDDDRIPRSKLAELERKRREWKIEQEKMREHEKRKQKMIQEYEEKRARELKLKSHSRRSRSHSRSGQSSRSESRDNDKDCTKSSTSRVPVMSEKCDSSSSNMPLFKGSEGAKIDINELKKIKVNIHRNISTEEETTELHREILNPEDVVLKRREGEGSKPLFDREELKVGITDASDVEERRTIVAIDDTKGRSLKSVSPRHYSRSQSPRRSIGEDYWRIWKNFMNLLSKGEGAKPIFDREELKVSKNDTADISERRTVIALNINRKDEDSHSVERNVTSSSSKRRDHSPRHSLRYESTSRIRKNSDHRSRTHERAHSTGRSREYRADYAERSAHSPRRCSPEDRRSHYHLPNGRNSHSLSRNAEHYRSQYRYDRNDSRYRRINERHRSPPTHYVEPIPVPIYYGNFPRPIMLDPMMTLRGPIPMMRGRIPISGGRPPFGPPYIPAEMYRPSAPNPRFNRMF